MCVQEVSFYRYHEHTIFDAYENAFPQSTRFSLIKIIE